MPSDLFSFLSTVTNPARAFLKPQDAKHGRAPFSFAQAFDWAGKFAHVLLAHGVRPGDRVAVQVEKSPENLFVYLACLRAGAVYLPLNPAYTAGELSHLLGDSQPRIFICSPEKHHMARAIFSGDILTLSDCGSGTLMEEAGAHSPVFANVPRAADDLAAILYTSGTTGKPKGAMLSHGNLSSNAQALKNEWRFTENDVLLHALPIFHTHGLFVATNVSLAAGAAIILLPKFDLDEIFKALPHATTMMGVPTFYTRLLSDPRLTKDAVRHIRLFISGSAPLLAETHDAWKARTGHEILERYGMTETNMNTSNPFAGPRKPGTVGLPLPGSEIRITDDKGVQLASNEVGRILVRGPNVFSGYWRQPERHAQDFTPNGFFITGDMGKLDDDGFLTIVGREKDLVITGGLNVYPKEVEILLDAIPGVSESAVFGVAHPDFGEGVTAALTLKPGAELSEGEILAALQNRLASFKIPKRVMILAEIPRNAMGKVQKNLLRERYKDLYK